MTCMLNFHRNFIDCRFYIETGIGQNSGAVSACNAGTYFLSITSLGIDVVTVSVKINRETGMTSAS